MYQWAFRSFAQPARSQPLCSTVVKHEQTVDSALPVQKQICEKLEVPVGMNEITEGVAGFESVPEVFFRFRVEQQRSGGLGTSSGKIWLENKSSKKQWECNVKNIADFAPENIAIPLETVLGYVAASLKATTTPYPAPKTKFEANLIKKSMANARNDELILEVTLKFEVSGLSWSPIYSFPMKEVYVEEIDILRSQLQDQREELDSLHYQVQTQQEAMKQLEDRVDDIETKNRYEY